MTIRSLTFTPIMFRSKDDHTLGMFTFIMEWDMGNNQKEFIQSSPIKVTYHFAKGRVVHKIQWKTIKHENGQMMNRVSGFAMSETLQDEVKKKLRRNAAFKNAKGRMQENYEVYKHFEEEEDDYEIQYEF